MAKINRTSLSHDRCLFSLRRASEIPSDQLAQGQSRLARWCELLRHVNVGTHTDTCGRIIGTDIREQKQHQQGSSLAAHIRAPFHEVRVFVAEADIYVPAIVTGRILRRESYWKSPERVTGPPAAASDQLVERCVQLRRICRLPKRGLVELVQPHNRTNPC